MSDPTRARRLIKLLSAVAVVARDQRELRAIRLALDNHRPQRQPVRCPDCAGRSKRWSVKECGTCLNHGVVYEWPKEEEQ